MSEAIFWIYMGLIASNKWILEAAIDRLEIQSWLRVEIVPNGISSLSMTASKIYGPNLYKVWKWPRITFEAVAEATLS